MSGDLLKYGGQGGSSWYAQFERAAFLDENIAENAWEPILPPKPVAHMREVIAKYAAMSEEEKQAGRDALMRKIDKALEVGK